MFAYSRDMDDALVLAAGIPTAWLQGEGIARRACARRGQLNYRLQRSDKQLVLEVQPGLVPPVGGGSPWPYAGDPGEATINGEAAEWTDRELHRAPAAGAGRDRCTGRGAPRRAQGQ